MKDFWKAVREETKKDVRIPLSIRHLVSNLCKKCNTYQTRENNTLCDNCLKNK